MRAAKKSNNHRPLKGTRQWDIVQAIGDCFPAPAYNTKTRKEARYKIVQWLFDLDTGSTKQLTMAHATGLEAWNRGAGELWPAEALTVLGTARWAIGPRLTQHAIDRFVEHSEDLGIRHANPSREMRSLFQGAMGVDLHPLAEACLAAKHGGKALYYDAGGWRFVVRDDDMVTAIPRKPVQIKSDHLLAEVEEHAEQGGHEYERLA